MSKRGKATCDDCYFRRAGLCALTPDAPCPTFRPRLKPTDHPRLVARTMHGVGAAQPA
jgi:hypothetical protein